MHARYMKHAREKAKTIAASHAEVDIAETPTSEIMSQAKRAGLTAKVVQQKGPGGWPVMRFDGPTSKLKAFLNEIGYDDEADDLIEASLSGGPGSSRYFIETAIDLDDDEVKDSVPDGITAKKKGNKWRFEAEDAVELKRFVRSNGLDVNKISNTMLEASMSSRPMSRKVKLKFINTAEAKDAQKKLKKFAPVFDGRMGLTIEVMNDAEEKEARKAAGIKASHVTIACASIKPYTMDVVIDLDDEEVQSTVESYSNTAYGPVTAKKLSGNKWRLTAAAAAPLWKIMREHQLKGKVMQDGMNVQPPSGVMHDVAKLNK